MRTFPSFDLHKRNIRNSYEVPVPLPASDLLHQVSCFTKIERVEALVELLVDG
jgi:hypothetical protein